MLKVFSQTS